MARKPQSYKMSDVAGAPEGEPFVAVWRDLITSPAWRGQSINCRRFVEFLIHEHMTHGGQENGNLVAPYRQLVAWGIGKRFIPQTIAEAEARLLVEADHGLYRGAAKNQPSRFRLTFLHSIGKDPGGRPMFYAAGNEWRSYKPGGKRARMGHQKPKAGHEGAPSSGHQSDQEPANPRPPVGHQGSPLSISRGGEPAPAEDNAKPSVEPSNPAEPISAELRNADEELRQAVLRRRERDGHGSITRMAAHAGVSRQHLSNFLARRYPLSADKKAALRDYVEQATAA